MEGPWAVKPTPRSEDMALLLSKSEWAYKVVLKHLNFAPGLEVSHLII